MEDRIDRVSLSDDDLDENKAHLQDMSINSEPFANNEESESSALISLFFYSILMFTVPLGGFVTVKQYLEQNLNLGQSYNLLVPIIVAVILVNLIIMLYILRAFRENAKDQSFKARPIEERKKLE